MPLFLKIEVEEYENSFGITDCTGVYSGSNTGGYGSINPRVDQVIESFIEVEPSGSKTPYPYKIFTTAKLPNTDSVSVEIFPSQIGMGDTLKSGKVKFKYTVITEDSAGKQKTHEAYAVAVFVNNITCCIDKLSPILDGNAFKDERQKEAIKLSNMLENVERLIGCGNYDSADKMISYMNAQCKCQGC